jgi:hypothetical protein
LLIDGDQGGRLAVQFGPKQIILKTDFRTADVFKSHDGHAIRICSQDNIFKFLRRTEATFSHHWKGHGYRTIGWRAADAASTKLLVLRRDRLSDVARRDAEAGHPIGLQPNSHRQIRGAQDRCLIRAGDALDGVKHVEVGVIANVFRIVAPIRRINAGG